MILSYDFDHCQMDEYPTISVNVPPSTSWWKFETIFKEAVFEGSILLWTIGFDGVKLITCYGQAGGEMQYTTRDVVPKRKNTINEQAHQEARQRYILKMREGYQSKEVVDIPRSGAMLANEYNLNKTKLDFPVACQPKIDGIRMLVSYANAKLYCMSRGGIPRKFFNHIKRELEIFIMYLPPNCVVDGELYSTVLTFNKLSGVCRKINERDPNEIYIKYYIFDINTNDDLSAGERYNILFAAYTAYIQDLRNRCVDASDLSDWDNTYGSKNIRMLGSIIVYNDAQIISLFEKFISVGFEGVIIRKLNNYNTAKGVNQSRYKPSRVNNLLKYKGIRQSEEVTIIGATTGQGQEEGLVIWEVADVRGNKFQVRPKGSFEERRELYNNYQSFIGMSYTIEHEGISEYGVPRCPVGVAIRNYE